jgi:hypothetical protein
MSKAFKYYYVIRTIFSSKKNIYLLYLFQHLFLIDLNRLASQYPWLIKPVEKPKSDEVNCSSKLICCKECCEVWARERARGEHRF